MADSTKNNWKFQEPADDTPDYWGEPFRDISAVISPVQAVKLYLDEFDNDYIGGCDDFEIGGRVFLCKSPEGRVTEVKVTARLEYIFSVEVVKEESH